MDERVTLRFRGLMLERYLERALKNGVTFHAVRRIGRREAELQTDAAGAARLIGLAERFGLDVVETQRRGMATMWRRLRRRATLPIALMLVAGLALAFLSRLWVVDIRLLDDSGDAEPIAQALERLNVVPGTRMDEIEAKGLSLMLMAEADEFAYIGARKQGVRLLIEATRELPTPDLYDPAMARDLVASEDALILSLDVMAGTAHAKPGQVVKKGDLLIRGEERDGRETTRGVSALGAVMARVWVTGEAEGALQKDVQTDTGRRAVSGTLAFMDYTWPLFRADGFATQRVEVERLPIGGLIVPLDIVRTTYIEQEARTIRLSEAAVKAEIAGVALERALAKLPEGVSPVDKWVDYSMIEGGRIRARAVLELNINIAVARGG